MAKTTDELFAEATEADYETIAPMVLAASDTEEEFQFRIDEHLRTIAIPEKGVVAGVEGDLNVNIARFTMVRYYHGRDLSKLSIRINYRNANGQVNYYNVSDAVVSGDSIVFSWEYAADVTQYKGNVQFVVYLFSATNAVLKQRFFTTLGTLEVLEGLEVDSSIPVSEQTDILLHLKKDLSAYAEEVKKSLPAEYTAMTEQVSSLKEDLETLNEGGLNLKDEVIEEQINTWIDEHPEATTTVQDSSLEVVKFTDEAKKNILNAQGLAYLSRYCVDLEMDEDGYYDLTEVIESLVEDTNINTVFIDVNVKSTKPIYMRDNISFVGNEKSEIKFPNNFGFQYGVSDDLSVTINNANIHNTKIVGDIYAEDYDESAYLINFRATCTNCHVHDVMVAKGANGIRIGAWVLTVYDILIWHMKGIGLGIFKSDNTIHNVYINNCKKQGLYMLGGSNSRITDFKILSCGADGVESVYIEKLNRAYFHGVEVQDAYYFPSFVAKSVKHSDISINVDGIRTHFKDETSVSTLALFESLIGNKIHIIGSKYGGTNAANEISDIISLNDNCFNNFISESFNNVIFSTANYNNKFAIPSKQLIYNGSNFETNIYSLVGADYLEKSESDTFIFGFVTGDVTYGGLRWKRNLITKDTKILLYAEIEPSEEMLASFTNTVDDSPISQTLKANIKNKFIMKLFFPSDLSKNPAITFNKTNATIKVYKWKVFDITDYTDEEISKLEILDIVE